MKGGIQHRTVQWCARTDQTYYWSPGPDLCPYCDLSRNARATGPYGGAESCPSDCPDCEEETK